MTALQPPTTAGPLRRLHDDRTYFTTDPNSTRAQLLAGGWTARRMRGGSELWRLGTANTEAACYFSGMILIHGAPVDLLTAQGESEQ